MKPLIGIITREDINETGKDIYLLYKSVTEAISLYNCIPLGIVPLYDIKDTYKLINLCDGIILQGGSDVLNSDIEIVKYIHDKDIPVLGICLGMQSMNVAMGAVMDDLPNNKHLSNNKYVHDMKLIKNTKFYNIIKKSNLKVNSRHKSYIKKTPLIISGYSDVIEVTEDPLKKFFIGVQYHIEDMLSYDKEENKIFKYFIDVCKEYMYEFKTNK